MQTAAPEGQAKPDPMQAPIATPVASASTPAAPIPALATPPTAPPAAPVETPLAVAVVSRSGENPPGGWGQSFARPLVADDSELASLHSRYRGVHTIAIDVDASGHATHVAIPADLTGEARAELARTLLALRYVPAECNGLRCTGTLQLAL